MWIVFNLATGRRGRMSCIMQQTHSCRTGKQQFLQWLQLAAVLFSTFLHRDWVIMKTAESLKVLACVTSIRRGGKQLQQHQPECPSRCYFFTAHLVLVSSLVWISGICLFLREGHDNRNSLPVTPLLWQIINSPQVSLAQWHGVFTWSLEEIRCTVCSQGMAINPQQAGYLMRFGIFR